MVRFHPRPPLPTLNLSTSSRRRREPYCARAEGRCSPGASERRPPRQRQQLPATHPAFEGIWTASSGYLNAWEYREVLSERSAGGSIIFAQVDGTSDDQGWPALEKDDEGLLEELCRILTAGVVGDPYSSDGKFALSIAPLPPGLRAMAATHWLDISLTLDSITWHFGNFGEAQLVAETEAGLRELGLEDLAQCFVEAKELMLPLLARRTETDGDPYEMLERAGLGARRDELDQRAEDLDNLKPDKSAIYEAWIRYTRRHPERVFGPPAS
jgi:hypothetical protein